MIFPPLILFRAPIRCSRSCDPLGHNGWRRKHIICARNSWSCEVCFTFSFFFLFRSLRGLFCLVTFPRVQWENMLCARSIAGRHSNRFIYAHSVRKLLIHGYTYTHNPGVSRTCTRRSIGDTSYRLALSSRNKFAAAGGVPSAITTGRPHSGEPFFSWPKIYYSSAAAGATSKQTSM